MSVTTGHIDKSDQKISLYPPQTLGHFLMSLYQSFWACVNSVRPQDRVPRDEVTEEEGAKSPALDKHSPLH